MSRLFGRQLRLVIGYLSVLDPDGAGSEPFTGLDVSELDVDFDVRKDLVGKPNVAKIVVHNLAEKHRTLLETAGTLEVELHAGYGENLSLIYRGEMRAAVTSREGADFVTTIISGDKHGMFAGRQIRVPLGEGTSAGGALKQLVEALAGPETASELLEAAVGVGRGNIDTVVAGPEGLKTLYPVGGVLSGKVSTLLTSLCRAANLEWSIQDGALQFLKVGAALDAEAIVLGSNSGLVGKIAVSNKGYVRATSLLIPGLRCGAKVVFDTETELRGGYRVEKIRYHGSKTGKEWYASVECKSY